MRCSSLRFAAGLAASLGVVSFSMGGTPTVEVLYSRAPSSPTSLVPGAVDLSGAPATARFSTLPEFWLSPDGSTWLLRATTDQGSDSANILIRGSGAAGTMVLQEGRPFAGAVGAEVIEFFSSSTQYPFNTANDWAFSLRARGGLATTFNKIVRYNAAGAGTLRFQMGDLYTGVVDIPANPSGDETIGNSTGAIHLLNDGRIGWHDTAVGNISTTRRPVLAYDAVKFLQLTDSVTALDNSGPVALSSIASTGAISVFQTSPDGTRTVVRGKADIDANGSATNDPDVVVVDGRVRVQAGQALPGDTITVSAVNQTSIAPNGDWYVRGAHNAGADAWAARNGAVIARTGQSIGADNWGASFVTVLGNSAGDWLIAGRSSNADPARDDVLVINGEVVLREGDAVSLDIDGNGTPETAFIGQNNNTLTAFVANSSAGLAPDGTAYIIANLRDSAGANLAASGTPHALLRITFPAGCAADFNGSGTVTVQDIFDFLAAYFTGAPAADVNDSGSVTVQDIFDYLSRYFAGC